MAKTVLGIIFGGKSTEYEVSCRSAYSVLENASKEKYDIVKIGVSRDGKWHVYRGPDEKIKDRSWINDTENLTKCFLSTDYGDHAVYETDKDGRVTRVPLDVVFPVMHGAYCEDGRLQGALDMSGIPYVGPGCASSAVCMDKAFTKLLLSNYGVPTAECVYVSRAELESDEDAVRSDVEEDLEYPVFVKPANSGSSVGITKVKEAKDLIPALKEAAKFDSKILVERAIVGREVEVAVIGNERPEALGCGEVIPGAEFYDYNDKYNDGKSVCVVPAKVRRSTWLNLKTLAEQIYSHLDCRGLSRVDFFVCDDEKTIVFNEINTLPGFTSISLYPQIAMSSGMKYSEVIDRLVALAFERREKESDE